MDIKSSVDILRVARKISSKSINILHVDSAAIKTEDIVHLSSSPSMVDNAGFALSPITPDSNKESSQLMSCFTSPLTSISCMNENDDNSNKTMKYIAGSRGYAARRLKFNLVKTRKESEKPVEDGDMLMEAFYDSILECIISDIIGEISAVDLNPDVLKTPRFAPRLAGIAEICPGPPLKSVKKSRNIDLSLCRKLEF